MSKRKISAIVIVLLVLIVGAFFIVWYPKYQYEKSLITYKDPKLTQQEKQVFLDRIAEDQKQLDNNKLSNEDRFKYTVDMGVQFYALGEYKKARDAQLLASKLLPGNPTVWAELFRAENEMHDYQNAEDHLQKAITINPASTNYWRWLLELEEGPLHLSNDRLKQGYEEALKATNSHVNILILYAKFLEKIGDLPGAVQQWKKAIEVNPEGKSTYEAEITRIQGLVK